MSSRSREPDARKRGRAAAASAGPGSAGVVAGQAPAHDHGHRPQDERLARLGQPFVVPGQTARAHHPAQRALHHPPPGWHYQDSAYSAVWADARKTALTEAQFRSPLGRRPYDLRHAAVSLWLNSGVPATEVARRAGHGVAVLLKIYAHCIDGQADAANQRITDALGALYTDQDPSGDEDDDSEAS